MHCLQIVLFVLNTGERLNYLLLKREQFPMKMCVGVHSRVFVFNPLVRDVHQCNKLTLDGFTTVHLFGSSKSITFALTYGMFTC